jgi:formylglycine-generating enzyme required for sulfatase activity
MKNRALLVGPILLVAAVFLPAPANTQDRQPGTTFRDCDICPELVVVRAGSFMMGSNDGRFDEKPARRVTIGAPLAVGKFEVTFAEWDACVADGGCKHKPDDRGWGRGQRPVMNVSWNDITKQYLSWLSRKTSKRYRLMTEAEWEYAARAGTTTEYAFGDTISKSQAQFSKWGSAGKTATVGSFKSNAFGLHDMYGNVFEWVQDCYKDSYSGAPTDGSAVTTGNCDSRVLRGGSWYSYPQVLRSALRLRSAPVNRSFDYGFRVVRMFTP